jgi:hypothetical protein
MTNFTFTQEHYMYQAKPVGVYPMKETDWERLKRMIKLIIPNKKIYQVLYSIAIGIFSSSVFSLITFQITTNIPNWALITTWICTIASLFLGIGFLIIDNQQKEIINQSSESIIKEMEIIEKTFDKPQE